jgi:hypothetical protein
MGLKRRIEKLESIARIGISKHISIEGYSLCVNEKTKRPYFPEKTATLFHGCDDKVRLLMGSYGSGKSTMCCAEIVLRACRMPPCYDGVRRSRWALIRNTYGDLTATTLKTWLEWFGELGIVRRQLSPRLRYHHTFNDGAGVVELELLFIALDTADDARKHLGSLELTGSYLNELSEIPQKALQLMQGRVNRFPAKRSCPQQFWAGIIADTNAPETDHWIYHTFEAQQLEGHRLFHQPPAVIKTDNGYQMNPEAENTKHLAQDYYLHMIQGQSEEFIRVFAMGYYGTVVDGKKVFPQYNDDIHAVDDIEIDENESILLAWDYGTVSPACLVLQFVADRLHVIKEFVCEYMTVKELAEQSVLPWLYSYARGLPVEVTADPANTYEGNEQLEELGLLVDPARTNKIGSRINSVTEFLNALVQGKPKLIISKSGCLKLRQGFLGKYCYKRLRIIGEEKYKDVPDKTHPISDIMDCVAKGAKITMADNSLMNIEDIRPGMSVLTPNGKRKVTHAWLARKDAVVGEYIFTNGATLIATPDHRMLTNSGWVRLCDLQYTDVLYSICKKSMLRSFVNAVTRNLKYLYRVFGLQRKGIRKVQKEHYAELQQHMKPRKNGMHPLKAVNGILNIVKNFGPQRKSRSLNAQRVVKNTLPILREKDFVQQRVNRMQGAKAALITKLERAWYVIKNLVLINTPRLKLVEVKLVSKKLFPEVRDVYDLTIEVDHCFFAEGICVHNCLQYACLYNSPKILSAFDDEEFPDFDHYDEDDKSRVGGY